MNKEEFISHVDNSIVNALSAESNLTEEILKIRGFSTPTIRHLFNNLCNIKGQYLEIGLYCGATFCASFNKDLTSVGIEDFSQNFGVDSVERELMDNIERAKLSQEPRMVATENRDCFKTNWLNEQPPTGNFNILFYDGEHSKESQAKALPHFLDNMADRFLFIVDDFAWTPVHEGTEIGFQQLKDRITIEKEWKLKGKKDHDDPIFHNGVGIFLISKTA